MNKIKLVVDNLEEEIRIDKYLSENEELDFTRSKIQKLIDEGNILVNNKIVKNSYKLQSNDEITIDDKEESYFSIL